MNTTPTLTQTLAPAHLTASDAVLSSSVQASGNNSEAAARVDDVLRQVLRTQWDGVTAVRLDSPPGAGKTGVVRRRRAPGALRAVNGRSG